MTSKLQQLITAGVIAIALASSSANAQAGLADIVNVPPVPANLQVPPGHTAFLKGQAVGTQNYICKTSTNGSAWVLFGPQATLLFTLKWFGGDIQQQIMTHFLSPNPDEGGIAHPTWQSSIDTSAAWARALASSVDPQFVAPGAIPWLLLEIAGSERGPAGGASLTPTKFIHRVNTAGGVAPAAGCSQPSEVGAAAFVPYTTDYYFYKANK